MGLVACVIVGILVALTARWMRDSSGLPVAMGTIALVLTALSALPGISKTVLEVVNHWYDVRLKREALKQVAIENDLRQLERKLKQRQLDELDRHLVTPTSPIWPQVVSGLKERRIQADVWSFNREGISLPPERFSENDSERR